MLDQKLNIVGLVDHKLVHDEPVETTEHENCVLITSSAWRNRAGAAVGGIGFAINKNTASALADTKRINERILVANFSGNPATTIIIHYSPTEGSADAEEHYNQLADVIKTIPKHNVLFVIGDFNAHLGKDFALFSYHDTTNSNGNFMIDLCQESDLVVTNTMFQKRKGKLWTYISDMTGHKSQVDYILVNRKWKNSVKNSEAYSSFSSLGSDHLIVTARVKLSLRTCKSPS